MFSRFWNVLRPRLRLRPSRPARRLLLEALENRLAPATFTVNSVQDLLTPPPGVTTLRSALQQANQTPGDNTINLAVAGTYAITLPGTPGETDNAAGEFVVLPTGGNLTIQNTSGGPVALDGNHLSRVLDINPHFFGNQLTNSLIALPPGQTSLPTAPFSVTLQGVTIQNGVAYSLSGPAGSGGGIRDQGNASLTLNNVVVTSNTAFQDGGGIAMENALDTPWTLTLNNSTVSYNHAGDAGGGIDTDGTGTVTINNSSLVGNTALNQGGAVWLDAIQQGSVTGVTLNTNHTVSFPAVPVISFSGGGGTGAAGTPIMAGPVGQVGNVTYSSQVIGVTITNPGSGYTSAPLLLATYAGNSFTIGVGNLQFQSANLSVSNSIISNNTALRGTGGGIGNAGMGTVSITSSTIANNVSGGTGGGFGDENNVGSLTVLNSAFLGNAAAGDGGAIQEGGASTSVTNTEIRGNTSGGNGGGLSIAGNGLTLLADTVALNRAAGHGGGLELAAAAGSHSSVTNCTIAGNSAVNTGGGTTGGGIDLPAGFAGLLTLSFDTINGNVASSGGGIFWAGTAGSTVGLNNTILAGNGAATGPDASSAGTFIEGDGNVIGVAGAGSTYQSVSSGGSQLGSLAHPLNPKLEVLAGNIGKTVGAPGSPVVLETEGLMPGSPALGAAAVFHGGQTTDERGIARPTGTPRPDSGAFQQSTQEHFVQALYLDELGRAGMTSELDGWVNVLNNSGGSQATVVNAIANSPEAHNHLVTGWYVTFLGRTPGAGEVAGWSGMLQTQTPEVVLSQLLSTTEFYGRAQTLVTVGTTDQRFVTALYQLLLNRTPGAPELAGWIQALPTLGRNGLALGLLTSQEYRNLVVTGDYADLLHRPADMGLTGWVLSGLDLGAVRRGFESSAEFFAHG
jgi:hypothetical protein